MFVTTNNPSYHMIVTDETDFLPMFESISNSMQRRINQSMAESIQVIQSSVSSFLSIKRISIRRDCVMFLSGVCKKTTEVESLVLSKSVLNVEERALSEKRFKEDLSILYAVSHHHLLSTKCIEGVLGRITSACDGLSMDTLLKKFAPVKISKTDCDMYKLVEARFDYSEIFRQRIRLRDKEKARFDLFSKKNSNKFDNASLLFTHHDNDINPFS